ncbi:hypothetical protein N8878_04230 [Psychromonas sp.]|nr:hypothetical protein [Psychromonas sp.]
MFIFKILTYLAGATTLGLFGYLYTVLDDKGVIDQVARIPADSVTTYHIVAAIIIAWLIFSLIMKVISRSIIIVLLVLAVGAEGTFVGLNMTGNIQVDVVDQFKEQTDGFMDSAKDLLDD